MSGFDPYEDYDPERAKNQGAWFIGSLVALVVVSGLIYAAAHRPTTIASYDPTASHIAAPTGSGGSQ